MTAPKPQEVPEEFKEAYRKRLVEPDYGHSEETVNNTAEYEYALAWDGRGSDSYCADDGSWGFFFRAGLRAGLERALLAVERKDQTESDFPPHGTVCKGLSLAAAAIRAEMEKKA